MDFPRDKAIFADSFRRDATGGQKNPFDIVQRLDSRGSYFLHSSFVFAAGRTIKSGKLNIPVNIFIIPGNEEDGLSWEDIHSEGWNYLKPIM